MTQECVLAFDGLEITGLSERGGLIGPARTGIAKLYAHGVYTKVVLIDAFDLARLKHSSLANRARIAIIRE